MWKLSGSILLLGVQQALTRKVGYQILLPKTSFDHAEELCSARGYELATFRDRLIPLMMRAMDNAEVDSVWTNIRSRFGSAGIVRRDEDLHLTIVKESSKRVRQRHAVLCRVVGAKKGKKQQSRSDSKKEVSQDHNSDRRRKKAKPRDETSKYTEVSVTVETGPSPGYSSHSTSERPSPIRGPQVISSSTASSQEHLIVSSKRRPHFHVRVNGTPVDPKEDYIRKLVSDLRKVPISQQPHIESSQELPSQEPMIDFKRSHTKVSPHSVQHFCPQLSYCPLKQAYEEKRRHKFIGPYLESQYLKHTKKK